MFGRRSSRMPPALAAGVPPPYDAVPVATPEPPAYDAVPVAAPAPPAVATPPAVAAPVLYDTDMNIETWSNAMIDMPQQETFEINGICYYIRYTLTPEEKKKIRSQVMIYSRCDACVERICSIVSLHGPSGPIFFKGITFEKTSQQLQDIIDLPSNYTSNPEMVLVSKDTFPNVQSGTDHETGNKWHHWTIKPEKVTSPSDTAKFTNLQNYMSQMDSRLEKLTVPEAIASVKIMRQVQSELERSEHWESVLSWVEIIQAQAHKPYSEMTPEEKIHFKVFCIRTGRTNGRIHNDFQQASNIVDFLTYSSREALKTEMDTRSDPANYQVSQLSRAFEKHGITSKYTISLVWDGKYTDDLDIHVILHDGTEIYYGCRKARGCILDFDANVTHGEEEPVENVSVVLGTYKILVNNYTRRTCGDVPFQVIIRQDGVIVETYDEIWPRHRHSGDKMNICTYTFKESAPVELVMSDAEKRRAAAHEKEWTEKFSPEVNLATLESFPYKKKNTQSSVSSDYMSYAKKGRKKGRKMSVKKFLSESCAEHPTTMNDLFNSKEDFTLSVHYRDCTPGYITEINTRDDVAEQFGFCHYSEKFKSPTRPTPGSGTARFDMSWLTGGTQLSVKTITNVNGLYFLVLDGVKLSESDDFPTAGGFYPTNLKAEYHHQRSRWTFCHTTMKPSIPAKGTPMIGTFLTGKEMSFKMNGKDIKVSI